MYREHVHGRLKFLVPRCLSFRQKYYVLAIFTLKIETPNGRMLFYPRMHTKKFLTIVAVSSEKFGCFAHKLCLYDVTCATRKWIVVWFLSKQAIDARLKVRVWDGYNSARKTNSHLGSRLLPPGLHMGNHIKMTLVPTLTMQRVDALHYFR